MGTGRGRGGAWVPYDRQEDYPGDPPQPEITTEDGATLITEDGEPLTTEA